MSGTNYNVTTAPYSGLVMIIGEIIAPMVSAFTSLLLAGVAKLTAPSAPKNVRTHSAPAPHVAMVLVPGNFMAGPFTYR